MEEYVNVFGKTKVAGFVVDKQDRLGLNTLSGCGWHQCNHLYHCAYPDGVESLLLLVTKEGKGVLRAAGVSFALEPGSVALVCSDTSMEYGTAGDLWEFFWLNLNGAALEQMARVMAGRGACVWPRGPGEEMIGLASTCLRKPPKPTVLSLQLAAVFHTLWEKRSAGGGEADDTIEALKREMEQRCAEPLSMTRLAEGHFLSKSQLMRQFKASTGYTPYEYLKNYRLGKAKEMLLYSEQTVEEIGRLTGFQGASNFVYQFRRRFGMSPGAFRRVNRVHRGTRDSS